MGERANIEFKAPGEPAIYFYTHWRGDELPEIVQAALLRGRGRWSDPSYLARIVFCELVKDEVLEETGFGISTQPCGDQNHPMVTIDCESRTVTIQGHVPMSFGTFLEPVQPIPLK